MLVSLNHPCFFLIFLQKASMTGGSSMSGNPHVIQPGLQAPVRCPGYALSTDLGPTNPRDKFAFVSDSALPAKPFSEIYQAWLVAGSPKKWLDFLCDFRRGMIQFLLV